MADKTTGNEKNIDSSNIFDEFTDGASLVEEVDKIKDERNKDLFFYISKYGSLLQNIFWFGIIVLILLFSYIYFQKDEDLKNSKFLDPFCKIFLGDIENKDSFCSSINSLKKSYSNDLELLKSSQISEILHILERLYEVENFTKTKEVLFLSDKSESKLKVLDILKSFDDMKNGFDIEKQKIQCNSLLIDSKKELLSMICTAYSAGYEYGLRGFDGTNNKPLKGTSISIANSFLNYIEKQSKSFTLIDRQKIFKSESVVGQKTGFTNKTVFSLKLKYNIK